MANVLDFSFSFTTAFVSHYNMQDDTIVMIEPSFETRFFRMESINCGEDQADGGIVLTFHDTTGI